MATLSDLRLRVKRTFSRYYRDLCCSTSIADPSESYEACRAYLLAWSRTRGPDEVRAKLEEETARIAGEVEQDLRRRHKDLGECFAAEPVEGRLEEIVEQTRSVIE